MPADSTGFAARCSAWFSAVGAVAIPLAAFLFSALCSERSKRRLAERAAQEQLEASERHARLREEERRGRVRAELRLREVASGGAGGESGSQGDDGSSGGFVFHPIGHFKSCYRNRCGTPRQGGVVPDCLAVLQCDRDLNPVAALEGFAAFSHCWVLYVFHQNTNLQRECRTASRRKQTKGRVPLWQGLCMKVAPPRCPDLRVGVLACRTPHRPNPIGLSLARVVSVDARAGQVVLAGLDVVDGTPCLDLKPYMPAFESVASAVVPTWVRASHEEPLMAIDWTPTALSDFAKLFGADGAAADESRGALSPRPFESPAALRRVLEDTLALDIRSPVQKGRHPHPGTRATADAGADPFFVGDLWFHELHVTYALLPSPPFAASPAAVRIERVERRPEVAGDAGGSSPQASP